MACANMKRNPLTPELKVVQLPVSVAVGGPQVGYLVHHLHVGYPFVFHLFLSLMGFSFLLFPHCHQKLRKRRGKHFTTLSRIQLSDPLTPGGYSTDP